MGHFLCPPAAWDPAHCPVAVAAVDGCRSSGPAVVVCGLAPVVAVAHMRPLRCTVADVAAVHIHIRPAGHCSSRHSSRAARSHAARSRNCTVGRRSTGRCSTAAVPAARVADGSIAVAAAAAAAGAVASDRRTAAGMPWRRGARYRLSGSAKPHAPGAFYRGVVLRIAPLSGGDLQPLKQSLDAMSSAPKQC